MEKPPNFVIMLDENFQKIPKLSITTCTLVVAYLLYYTIDEETIKILDGSRSMIT